MFKVTTTISREKVAGILCTGFEGGMTSQWAEVVSKRKPKKPVVIGDDWAAYPLYAYPVSGGAVRVKDAETGKVHVLNQQAIQHGLEIMQEKYPRHFGDFMSDNDDAITGDVFIQCCLLGDVVYG